MLRQAIPVLHVEPIEQAREFYRTLGFEELFAYRFNDAQPDPCYMGLHREGVTLHVSSFSGDAVAGGVVFIVVDDIDALHQDLQAKGVAIKLPPTDQTWGNREMYIADPNGNSLRFVHGDDR
jgi:catechol 2,3-dioxygenase-like lactoylglutathione lyase family enzyme